MTLPDIIAALGPSGLGVAALSTAGMLLKFVAWRLRARDLRQQQARLASATTAEQRALIASTAPPDLPDQIFKVLVIALLSGLGLACTEPAYRLAVAARSPAERCRPACERGQRCVGSICTMDARPLPESDTATSAAQPEKPQAPQPPRRPIGPQSSNYAVTVQRWTDGRDPFDRYEQ